VVARPPAQIPALRRAEVRRQDRWEPGCGRPASSTIRALVAGQVPNPVPKGVNSMLCWPHLTYRPHQRSSCLDLRWGRRLSEPQELARRYSGKLFKLFGALPPIRPTSTWRPSPAYAQPRLGSPRPTFAIASLTPSRLSAHRRFALDSPPAGSCSIV